MYTLLVGEGSVRRVVRAVVPLPAVGKAVAGKSTDACVRYIGGICTHHRNDTFIFGLKPHFLKGCISVSLSPKFRFMKINCGYWLTPFLSPPPQYMHRKKRFTSFPSPAGTSLTKLPLGRNNSVMTSLFPPRESLVVTSRLGTGNSRIFFLRCALLSMIVNHISSFVYQDYCIS
jgi:hypothetical protein